MAYTKLFIHAIFIVKDRLPLITPEIENKVFDKMVEQVEKCKSKVLAINGYNNHVHILISMSPDTSFSELVKQVKGATSHWMNSNDLIKAKFSWQKGGQRIFGKPI